jgi:hypothetical protein
VVPGFPVSLRNSRDAEERLLPTININAFLFAFNAVKSIITLTAEKNFRTPANQ